MSELDNLAIQFGTDKSSLYHNYTEKYERFFHPWKHRKLNILEIGIYEGASLKMWEAYFPNAQIWGMDINPQCKNIESPRIKVLIGDQR